MCFNGLAMMHFGDSDFVIRLNWSAYPISSDCNVNWVLLIMALYGGYFQDELVAFLWSTYFDPK
jgi:hypothetical protein